MSRKLLTPEQAAEALGVTRHAVYQMSYYRRIKVVKIGRNLRIPEDAIDELIRRGERKALV